MKEAGIRKRHHPPPPELLWLLETKCDITGGGRSWGHRMLRAHLMGNSGIRPTLQAVLDVQRAHDPAATQARLERLLPRGNYNEKRAMRIWHIDSALLCWPALVAVCHPLTVLGFSCTVGVAALMR